MTLTAIDIDTGTVNRFRLACRSGKDALFKFRPFTTAKDQNWVADILVNHRVYFSRVSELNDPYDLRPEFVLAGDSRDPSLRARILQQAEKTFRAYRPPYTEAWIAGQLAELQTIELVALAERAGRNISEIMERDHPVFCLAGNRESAPMWTAYADQHSGLCVHFKSTAGLGNDHVFGTARRVLYRPSRPQIPLPLDIDQNEMMDRLALTKHQDWSYEDEYRVLTYPGDDFGIVRNGSFGTFDVSALQGLTIGVQMSPDNVRLVLDLAHRHIPRLPVWQAVRRQQGYGFDFQTVM